MGAGRTAWSLATMSRPPSVDALARSLAGTGLPHPLLVDVARAAIADGAVDDAPARAEDLRRTLLTTVVNATGVLLHTNLGRAPVAHHQPARAESLELDLATGERGSRQRGVGSLLARLYRRRGGDRRQQQRRRRAAGAGRPRRRPRRAGQPGRERRDRRWVPRPRGDGPVGRPSRRRRHHEPHPPRRLPPGRRAPGRRRGPRAQGAPEQLPHRRLRRGDDRRRAGHARGAGRRRSRQRPARCHLPVAARAPTRRRGWPASRPPARPWPPAPRS